MIIYDNFEINPVGDLLKDIIMLETEVEMQ